MKDKKDVNRAPNIAVFHFIGSMVLNKNRTRQNVLIIKPTWVKTIAYRNMVTATRIVFFQFLFSQICPIDLYSLEELLFLKRIKSKKLKKQKINPDQKFKNPGPGRLKLPISSLKEK